MRLLQLLSFLFLFFCFKVNGQNLIANPSFEAHTGCPSGYSEISNAAPWDRCGLGTSDFFNVCATSTIVSVPSNFIGSQHAASGNGYAGFLCYNGREYISAKLTTTLVVGTRYHVSFKVSRSDNPWDYALGKNVGINKLGARFRTIQCPNILVPDWFLPYPDNIAHVYTNWVISSTTDWTTISGSFIADSAYQYIVIGNFFNDAYTTTTTPGSSNPKNNWAYYYVDDVCVSSNYKDCIGITGLLDQDHKRAAKVQVFPDPVSTELKVFTLQDQVIRSVKLKNIQGAEITKFTGNSTSELTLDLSSLQNSIYFLEIDLGEVIVTERFIKN